MNEILAFPGIYHDVRNTKRVPETDLQKFFGIRGLQDPKPGQFY